jgi:hypothetical protein
MGFRPRGPTQQVSFWHQGFADCVTERAPPGFETFSEFPLSLAPRRADILLLRRKEGDDEDNKNKGRILRALWPRLASATLLEFKSPTRGFRRSDLIRLISYGFQYHAQRIDELCSVRDVTLVLVTPCPCPALDQELACMNWSMRPLGDGYAELAGACYNTYVAFTNQVAEAEQDDLLRVFSHLAVQTTEVLAWLEGWMIMKDTGEDVKQHPEYGEMLSKLLSSLPPETVLKHYKAEDRLVGLKAEDVLKHYKAEDVLKHYKAEDRLVGLTSEETFLALPDEVLRGLPDEYIRSLPRSVQTAIRRRLSRPRRR